MRRARMPVRRSICLRNAPPFSASRVALVATARISSTSCELARRANFDSACSAAVIASGVSFLPSRPPAPSRTISFSRSTISNEKSGLTRTTIMWTEFVPMSMAARRTRYNQANRSMEHSALSVALLRQRLVSLLTAMPAAQAGDEISVHQARVASRRLREALPVLGARADEHALDRAERRVRRITRALGPVRELDVTLSLLAELEGKGAAPKRGIARVRKAVIEERMKRRRAMLAEIKPSRLEKLRKRLVRVAAPETRKVQTRTAIHEAEIKAAERAHKL